jgi:hypothetical protein
LRLEAKAENRSASLEERPAIQDLRSVSLEAKAEAEYKKERFVLGASAMQDLRGVSFEAKAEAVSLPSLWGKVRMGGRQETTIETLRYAQGNTAIED